jgi:hypothetical protein
MATRRQKGDRPAEGRRRAPAEREGARREATDPREEEGYGQPESSAQRAPPRPGEAPGHPE